VLDTIELLIVNILPLFRSPLRALNFASPRVAAALDVSTLTMGSAGGRTLGLRDMLNIEIHAKWHKDKKVTCSDWDAPGGLTLPQLKYAALDAWASEVLGRVSFQEEGEFADARKEGASAGLLFRGPLFSTLRLPLALALGLSSTLDEAQAYQDAGKEEFEVECDNVTVDTKKTNSSRVSMHSYGKRLREKCHVEARCGAGPVGVGTCGLWVSWVEG
jgi:hypothetical protein